VGDIRIFVRDDLHKRLKAYAAKRGKTLREVIESLIENFVEREE